MLILLAAPTIIPVLQTHAVLVRVLAFAIGRVPRLAHLPGGTAVDADNRRRSCRILVAGREADAWWIE